MQGPEIDSPESNSESIIIINESTSLSESIEVIKVGVISNPSGYCINPHKRHIQYQK